MLRITLALLLCACPSPSLAQVTLKITAVEADVPANVIEIHNVTAGPFQPRHWRDGTLHLLPDARRPLLAPREGQWRNIYAPSAVEIPGGWRLFYGAWDGAPTGNDRIYSALTRDFLEFTDRRTVIEHGPFHHVCNVNAIRLDDGSFAMVCTAYPDQHGHNKPIFFSSPDGETWNSSTEPYTATMDDLVVINGYDNYPGADINGMNVILHENGMYRLWFADFRNFGKVYRASGKDGRRYRLDGPALDGRLAPNDVKKFRVGSDSWYLMGLHMNTDRLFYSLSRNGARFPEARELMSHRDDADRYIVAIGWVVRGEQEKPGRQLLGVLYGAGAVPSLDQNRIFASWLQKKAVLVTDNDRRLEPAQALGPDRQRIVLDANQEQFGIIELYAEDGQTLIGTSNPIALHPGRAYRLTLADK